jgi:hypothetical protein
MSATSPKAGRASAGSSRGQAVCRGSIARAKATQAAETIPANRVATSSAATPAASQGRPFRKSSRQRAASSRNRGSETPATR